MRFDHGAERHLLPLPELRQLDGLQLNPIQLSPLQMVVLRQRQAQHPPKRAGRRDAACVTPTTQAARANPIWLLS